MHFCLFCGLGIKPLASHAWGSALTLNYTPSLVYVFGGRDRVEEV
jgi:hypothetical protein